MFGVYIRCPFLPIIKFNKLFKYKKCAMNYRDKVFNILLSHGYPFSFCYYFVRVFEVVDVR